MGVLSDLGSAGRQGTCHAPGVLMSGADKQGQESWEWSVYKALWSYPRQWFSPLTVY